MVLDYANSFSANAYFRLGRQKCLNFSCMHMLVDIIGITDTALI